MICFDEDEYRGFPMNFSLREYGTDDAGIPIGLDWFLNLPDCFKSRLIRIVTKYHSVKEHTGLFYYNVYMINDKKSFLEICDCLKIRYDFIYFDIPCAFGIQAHFMNLNSLLAVKAIKLYINSALIPYIREYSNVI